GFVHAAGILHRDISPDNILLDDRFEPVLIDFGAAREEATRKSRVLSALRVVKDGYSPQEFYVQGSEQGPSSDLYSLAASFYHLISGNLPPDSQVRVTALASGEPDPYQPLQGQVPELSNNFLRALDRAMNVIPKDRVQSAKEWIEMLDGVEPVRRTTRALSREAAVEAGPNSSRGMILASVATVALLGGLAAWQSGMLDGAEPTVSAEATSEATTETPPVAAAQDDTAPNETETAEAGTVDTEADEPTPADTTTAEATPAPDADGEEDTVTAEASQQQETVEQDTVETPGRMASAPRPRPADAGISIGFQDGPDAPSGGQTVEAQQPTLAAVEPVTSPSDAPAIEEAERPTEAPGLDVTSAPAVTADSGRGLELDQTTTNAPQVETAVPSPQDDTTPIQDVASAALSTDDTPDAPPPDGTAPLSLSEFLQQATDDAASNEGSTFISAPVVEPTTPDENQFVQSVKMVELPFEGLFDETVGNLRVFAVEGTPVSNREEFDAVMQTLPLQGSVANVTVSLGVSEATAVDAEWRLPILHEARLINGLTFESRQSDGTWQTEVTEVPTGLSDVLSPGDLIVGLLDTSERIDGPLVLTDILERELDNGKDTLNLAVLREGSMWGVNISLSDLRTASAD
ncbi:MAG: hypothetical protein AAGJ53_00585, partial [Pseudomonadota bacterium]